ncbi:putative holin [Cupriavidus basilensis]|uniref:Phage-related protein n=1 Tax=Cupriavidus basilensis TaxID=68895 RepID=A0A0C4Y812_9BURK|nr:putative holin [Cupriavidus basilensis]AJG19130.1 Phage-related protein [Cupriavidus basilensis]
MAEPIAASSATAVAVTAAGAISLLPGVDAGTVLGAFAGAAVFVLNSEDLGPLKKMAFLALSVIAGCMSAPLTAYLIDWALPPEAEVSHGVGALVASAVVVKLLLALIRVADNGDKMFALFKGGTRGDRK